MKANLPYIFLPNPDSNNPLEKQRDPHLYEKLSTAGELSGILNLVIFRAKEIAKTKTIIKRSGEEMFNEYADQSTSVGTFLELFCEYVEDAGFWTPPGPIYDDYKEWCCYKVGEVVDPRYFGKLLKEFCGGTACKIGKDADRKSIRLYKGLNFDSWKCKGALEALKLSMSTSGLRKSTSSLQGDSSTDSDVYMSTSNTWIDIYRMFGPIKKEILYNKENRENHVEHVDNVDIDSSGGLPPTTHCRRDEDNVDKPQFCAKCGEDLTGHGTRTIGDVVYCLKPGCGMPEREEAGA